MTADEVHAASRDKHDLAATTLMAWVANAQKMMDGGKLDGLATARIGELLLNACKYLSDREDAAKKEADRVKYLAESAARKAESAARNAAIYRATTGSK